jgi:hypothetical protein
MARDESEYHRYKKSIQTSMLLKTGTMGNGLATERLEDVMTDPEDYFILPPRIDDRLAEGGDLWEIVEQ